MKYISRLYIIEKQAGEKNFSPEKICVHTQLNSVPVLEEFERPLLQDMDKNLQILLKA